MYKVLTTVATFGIEAIVYNAPSTVATLYPHNVLTTAVAFAFDAPGYDASVTAAALAFAVFGSNALFEAVGTTVP